MAQLQSAGVSVTVIDESFYTPAAPGTVPLIVVASKENKATGAGTGTAPGTLKSNAGKVYLLTSQKDLSDTFGTPIFETDTNNNPVHAGELNEYGLQAAYSFLGVSNSAYVVRADVDLGQLSKSTDAPDSEPADGTIWVDTASTHYGVFQWNSAPQSVLGGQTFTSKTPIVISDTSKVVDFEGSDYTPLSSIGSIGSYAVVSVSTLHTLWFKKPKTTAASLVQWVEVGSSDWVASWPTAQGSKYSSNITIDNSHTLTINGQDITHVTTLAGLVSAINASSQLIALGITAGNETNQLQLFSTGIDISISGTTANDVGLDIGTYRAPALSISKHTQIPRYKISDNANTINGVPTGSVWIKTTAFNLGANWKVKTYSTTKKEWVENTVSVYKNNAEALKLLDATGGGVNISVNSLYLKYNDSEITTDQHSLTYPRTANFKLYRRKATGATTITSDIITSSTFSGHSQNATISSTNTGGTITFSGNVTLPRGTKITTSSSITGGGIAASTSYYVTAAVTNSTSVTVAASYANAMASSPILVSFTSPGAVTNGQSVVTYAVTYSFSMSETLINNDSFSSSTSMSFNVNVGDTAYQVANAIAASVNNAGFVNIIASVDTLNHVSISHVKGGDIILVDETNTPLSSIFSVSNTINFYAATSGVSNVYNASNWSSFNDALTGGFSIASASAPSTLAEDGQLWYDSNIDEVDILVHNGQEWVGYQFPGNIESGRDASPYYNATESLKTDSNGPIISATKPKNQTDGTPLVIGDLWISTADLENYPLVYIYNFNNQWTLLDNSDQTTENGILFHDVRSGTSGGLESSAPSATIKELLSSDYVDVDAPDPALYPKGMLLWNLRRSGFNVKKFVHNYIDVLEVNNRYGDQPMTDYYPHRWISAAANQPDGSGSFGRKAQRSVVIKAMAELINSNQQIRDEDRRVFNLLSAPGYPELIKPLVNLNTDRGLTAFVIGDTPARLTSDATTLSSWGMNENNTLEDNDTGLITTDPYLGVFYPWGYTRDNIGNNIAVPPSYMMLRTIALSDNVSYPWFAPAGVRRGGITNASAVGYITAEGEFNAISLNTGQRDTLQNVNVNPITYIVGTGLVNYGQKTRQLAASAMDRINVARLVIYLRVQLARISKPYIFEPNDTQTRNEIKQQIESFLLELVGQRALYDFLVVCDTSNNTPKRIDANELYVDIAIEPVKAVEYIYIPLRIENTGAIAKLGQ